MILVLQALTLVLTWMPRGLIAPLASVLAVIIQVVNGRDLRRLRHNVQRVYGLPPGTHFAKMFERQCVRHTVTCALETLRIIQEGSAGAIIVGDEELRKHVASAEAAGKGHILVTAHLGSWELCAAWGQRVAQRPFHVLAKPPRQAAARRYLERAREAMGVDVFWTDRKSLVRDMLSALRQGESVGFVMDQKPEGRKGPVVSFLGIPTEFVSGPAQMAIRTGCAVISIFVVREGAFRYRVISRELVPAGRGIMDEMPLTQGMAAEIERVVRLYPEQWTWNYKRWRRE